MQQKHKAYLRNISPSAWEHPTDRAALGALKKIPGLDIVLQKFFGATTERSLRLITLASAIRVSDNQFPKLHNLLREAGATLDIQTLPELYVSQNPFLNASAVGVDHPFIVLNSSLLDSLSDEEMMCVIAHELGHCASGHVLYKTLLALLVQVPINTLNIPLSGVALLAIIMALREWDRKSELTADRAGLLVVQDPDISYRLLMKMAGANNPSQISINEFFVQAAEYEGSGNLADSVYKLLNLVGQSHPFPVLRLTELKTWVDRGDYGRILSGDYPQRKEAPPNVRDSFREAKDDYKSKFAASNDPIENMTSKVMDAAETVSDKARDIFGSFFNNRQ
jgi:Zn-dependent protease with chaperone function